MEIIQGSSAPPSDPWSLSDAESWYKKIKIRNRLRGRPALSGGRPSFESLSRGMSLSRCGPRGLAPGLAASLRKRRGSTILPLPPPSSPLQGLPAFSTEPPQLRAEGKRACGIPCHTPRYLFPEFVHMLSRFMPHSCVARCREPAVYLRRHPACCLALRSCNRGVGLFRPCRSSSSILHVRHRGFRAFCRPSDC